MAKRIIQRISVEHDCTAKSDRFICSLCKRQFKEGLESRVGSKNVILFCLRCVIDIVDIFDDLLPERIALVTKQSTSKSTVVIDSEGRLVAKHSHHHSR